MLTNIAYLIGFIACYFAVKQYTHNKYPGYKWKNIDMAQALVMGLSSWIGVLFIGVVYYNEQNRFTDWFDDDAKF